MTIYVVEVLDATGTIWEEISRYDSKHKYISTRHHPPKSLTGIQISIEDKQLFEMSWNYDRQVRIRKI